MKKVFTLSVPTPCQEKWDDLMPNKDGRFCNSCLKTVIDFTAMSESEIKIYFLQHNNVCGRFKTNQLKSYAHVESQQYNWKLAAFLAFISFLFNRQTFGQARPPVTQEQVDISKERLAKADTLHARIVVEGIVLYADDGSPIPGVNILRKETNESVISNEEGKFKIILNNLTRPEQLIVSFIGLDTQEITVASNTTSLEVRMKTDITQLGEVVVGGAVAYHRFSPRRIWFKVVRVFRR